ncbi:translation initiation factor IF-2 [Aminithiophilus ramosus]|uniref:Translation initiation factor IF-2 n=2 Tax=Synergistales TaxID=649776 RepID=A0A9Q7A4B8_9BACT|nr:translation initiation factor IF-2 [Aminithiophilus ramosus]QVL37479.1 translation initiation factor IF-2 [Synergistota bacterium]
MSKIRVYELAKMLDMSNKELMEILESLKVDVKTHMSSIDTETAQLVEDTIKSPKKEVTPPAEEDGAMVCLTVPSGSSVGDVAKVLCVPAGDVVKRLVEAGMMVPAGAPADSAVLEALGVAFGKKLVAASDEQPLAEKNSRPQPKGDNLVERPPIVTVMGHVDHGKTTLLDHIRHTRVADREAGGITQHIGASVVSYNAKRIVFLDTPGHAAFTSMRARGAQVTDIAILVVAADDGVMPQTIEALNHAKAAGVPIIVALNKIDKAGANPDKIRQQLSDQGLVPEEWGGDTIVVEISAKQGIGIDNLLEMILILAEMLELRADPAVEPEGVVVEAELDKGKGPVATVIVRQGTLHRGDIVLTDTTTGRIRAMIDASGNYVDEAGPSMPVELLGLSDVPQPGERFHRVGSEREARGHIADIEELRRRREQENRVKRMTLEELYSQMQQGEVPQLNVVLKCDVQGTAEAIRASLEKLATDEVGISIVHVGVGRISESDVMLAAASNAIIIGFDVRPDANAKKISDSQGVQIRLYRVIYDIIDDVRAALEGMLAPTLREKVIGQVEIRAAFKVPKAGKIAGCYVLDGIVRRNAKVRLVRDGIVYWEGSLSSLKRFKDDVREVAAGYECGMSFTNFQDFSENDIVEVFEIIEEKRSL